MKREIIVAKKENLASHSHAQKLILSEVEQLLVILKMKFGKILKLGLTVVLWYYMSCIRLEG